MTSISKATTTKTVKKGENLIIREVITIGSDPEFAIVNPVDGATYNADEVFQPKNPHAIDCDFGYDGHSATGEIRPKPADSPKKAIEIIEKLLENNKKKYPQAYKYNLMSTSSRLSLGGHIHFGNKKFLNLNTSYHSPFDEDPEGGKLSRIGITLVHNLDNLLAFPSMFLENKNDAIYRRGTSYGGFSDARPQLWGFEYRTLSSFIASKELTSNIFYLGYAIADATLNFKYKCANIVQTDGFDNAFRQQYRELLKPYLKYVFKQHKTLPLYKEDKSYKSNIDNFDEMVKNETPLFNTEIKKGWNIEFDIADFWKIEKLETLLEKVTKLLIAVHTLKRKTFKPIVYNFVKGSIKDIGCVEIAYKVNLALNTLIDKEIITSKTWKTLQIFGLKKSRKNEVWLGNMGMTDKRQNQILGYLWEIASEFSHQTKIEDIRFNPGETSPYQVGFGRQLREENVLIAETMTIITLLMINRDLFKQTQKVDGKVKKFLVTKHKVVNTIIKSLKKTKKFKAIIPLTKSPRLNDIELPLMFDLNKTFAQLVGEIQLLDTEVKVELCDICIQKFTSKKGNLRPILNTSCIVHCEQMHDLINTPLKELCPLHLAKMIVKLCGYLPIINHNFGWSEVFSGNSMGTVRCGHCNRISSVSSICSNCKYGRDCCCSCWTCSECEAVVYTEDFCTTCDRCSDCCEYCESCGNHYAEECNCSTCNVCGSRFSSENFCFDCDNCNSHCSCPATPSVSEPTTTINVVSTPVATTSNAIPTPTHTPTQVPPYFVTGFNGVAGTIPTIDDGTPSTGGERRNS